MIRPITNHNKLGTKIIDFLGNIKDVKILLRFGSKLDNSFNLLSDLDFFVLTDDIIGLQNVLQKLNPVMILNYDCRSVLYFEFTNVYSEVIKIDLKIASDIKEYYKFVENIKDLTEAVIINRTGIDILKYDISYKNTTDKINYHVNRFIEAFENCSVANQSSDQYRFLFHQTIALQHLYTLEYMANDELKYNYLPKQFTNTIQKDIKHILKKDFDPNSNLVRGRITRLNLLKKFKLVLNHISQVYNKVNINQDQIMDFLNTILLRDWIWNIRDISDINPEKLNGNILIRSSSLSFYNNEDNLLKFLDDFKIQSIIDLRHKEEIDLHPYSNQSLNYFNVQIGAKHIKPHNLRYTEIGVDPFFYEYFPRHYKEEIAKIFTHIINAPKPIILHCYAGKDRTGIIVAMIQKLVGLSDKEIIMDYISSRSDTRDEKIKITLKLIDEIGGIVEYLEYIGLSKENILILKNIFVK